MKKITYIGYLLWIILFLAVLLVFYYISSTVKLTDGESFGKNSEQIVRFYQEHWEENFSTEALEDEQVHPQNPMEIRYTVMDADNHFLAAYSRDIQYNLDYKIYEIRINGQKRGEIWIHYEQYFAALCDRIKAQQAAAQKACICCLGLLMVFALAELCKQYQRRKKPV